MSAAATTTTTTRGQQQGGQDSSSLQVWHVVAAVIARFSLAVAVGVGVEAGAGAAAAAAPRAEAEAVGVSRNRSGDRRQATAEEGAVASGTRLTHSRSNSLGDIAQGTVGQVVENSCEK